MAALQQQHITLNSDELELIRSILMSDEDYVEIPKVPEPPRETVGWVSTDEHTPRDAMVQAWPPVEPSAIPYAHSVDPNRLWVGWVPTTPGYVLTRVTLN